LTPTLNLEALFPSLDFYILLSSAIGVIGSASQSIYSAGEAFQDTVSRRYAMVGKLADIFVIPEDDIDANQR
jgi:hypothetical protein